MQPPSRNSVILAGAILLGFVSSAVAHGHDENQDMNIEMGGMPKSRPTMPPANGTMAEPASYFQLTEHTGLMFAHILLMTIGWVFVLPIGMFIWRELLLLSLSQVLGVILSISRSRYSLPIQFVFLSLNAVGVLLVTIYNTSTPDLYPNNAHHKLGWILTWVVSAQVVMGVISAYTGREDAKNEEQTAFMPVSAAAMAQHQRMQHSQLAEMYRFSNDSGQGTEPNTESLRSHSISSRGEDELPEAQPALEEVDLSTEKQGLMRGSKVDRYLSKRIPGMLSSQMLRIFQFFYDVVDRLILILGFAALATGIITYGGLFVS